MRLHVDREADALYLHLDDSKIIESEEVSPGVVLDYNADDQVVGIEILQLSKRAPNLDVGKLVVETRPPWLADRASGLRGTRDGVERKHRALPLSDDTIMSVRQRNQRFGRDTDV